MAKIKPIEIISSMSGKVCTHGDMYFAVNKQTGQVHTAKMCNPYHGEPSEAQKAQREKFATRAKAVSQWLDNNKPVEGARPNGTELYQKVLAAYKSQHKVGSLFGYVSKKLTADGTIEVPDVPTGGGGSVTPTPNPGGDEETM